MNIICINNDGAGASEFGMREIDLNGTPERMLSQQIPSLNFRLRTSDTTYSSDWHIAGDPTLLVVLRGSLKIVLRSGVNRDFSPGDLFIAQDYLPQDIKFDNNVHGHRAAGLTGNAAATIGCSCRVVEGRR